MPRIYRSTCWPAVQRATTIPRMPQMNTWLAEYEIEISRYHFSKVSELFPYTKLSTQSSGAHSPLKRFGEMAENTRHRKIIYRYVILVTRQPDLVVQASSF